MNGLVVRMVAASPRVTLQCCLLERWPIRSTIVSAHGEEHTEHGAILNIHTMRGWVHPLLVESGRGQIIKYVFLHSYLCIILCIP
jgi:hypothetical protein